MTEQIAQKTFTIRDTNSRIRAIVEQQTVDKPFWTSGLVRKLFVSDLRHQYFELYDDDWSIRCMVRDAVGETFTFTITNGMEIEVLGTIRVYEKTAKIELEVQKVRWVENILPVLNEDVEARLRKSGLWPRQKRALPDNIRNIGLITSKQSEALDDFRETYRREGGFANIIVEDVRIQGQQAPRDIADAIRRLNQQSEVDIIVLTRGGGRNADLAVFSDYLVAEAICQSTMPVVTGIGHESNETFADIAADVKTSTPTAAAVYVAKDRHQETQIPVPKPLLTPEKAAVVLIAIVIVVVFVVLILVG